MARRRVKTTQHNNDTEASTISGLGGQERPSFENDAPAHTTNGVLSSDTRTRIEKLAYQLYEQRGCRHGDDWKDWLEAERLTVGAEPGAE